MDMQGIFRVYDVKDFLNRRIYLNPKNNVSISGYKNKHFPQSAKSVGRRRNEDFSDRLRKTRQTYLRYF